jgi:hypothetical protein
MFRAQTRPYKPLHYMQNRLRWLNFNTTTRPVLDSVPNIQKISWCRLSFVEKLVAAELQWLCGSNTLAHAFSQLVEPMALAQFQFLCPSSTCFRPTYLLINEMSLCYRANVNCGRASVIEHVQASLCTTCRTDCVGLIFILSPVQYLSPSYQYKDKLDVVLPSR